jgi:hypothetical protein
LLLVPLPCPSLFTLFLALGLTSLLRGTAWFQGHFNYRGVSFFSGYAAIMILDIIVALAVIVVLWLMKRDRKAFFLVKGRMDAPLAPIRWLGIKAGASWKTCGWIFAGGAALAVFVPTILGIAPSAAIFLRACRSFRPLCSLRRSTPSPKRSISGPASCLPCTKLSARPIPC